jgi:copper chaperone CopZ
MQKKLRPFSSGSFRQSTQAQPTQHEPMQLDAPQSTQHEPMQVNTPRPTQHEPMQVNTPQPLNKVVFQAQGMHCASCGMTIERKLRKLAGVDEVTVDVSTGKVEVFCDRAPQLPEVQQAVQADGYTILPWQEQRKARAKVAQGNTWRDYGEMGLIVLIFYCFYQIFAQLQIIPSRSRNRRGVSN